MPIYEYSCPKCGKFERLMPYEGSAIQACPECGEACEKLPPSGLKFRGDGWFRWFKKSDYGKSGLAYAPK